LALIFTAVGNSAEQSGNVWGRNLGLFAGAILAPIGLFFAMASLYDAWKTPTKSFVALGIAITAVVVVFLDILKGV